MTWRQPQLTRAGYKCFHQNTEPDGSGADSVWGLQAPDEHREREVAVELTSVNRGAVIDARVFYPSRPINQRGATVVNPAFEAMIPGSPEFLRDNAAEITNLVGGVALGLDALRGSAQ